MTKEESLFALDTYIDIMEHDKTDFEDLAANAPTAIDRAIVSINVLCVARDLRMARIIREILLI